MKKKIKIKKILYILFFIYIAYVLVKQQLQMGKINSDITAKKAEYTKQQEKNQKLQDLIKMIESEPDLYIEKIAREKLDLIKKDETPVINSQTTTSNK